MAHHYPVTVSITTSSPQIVEIEDGQGIELEAHDSADNTMLHIGFRILEKISDNRYRGLVTALEVTSSDDGNSDWYLLLILSDIGMCFNAEVDLQARTILVEDPGNE